MTFPWRRAGLRSFAAQTTINTTCDDPGDCAETPAIADIVWGSGTGDLSRIVSEPLTSSTFWDADYIRWLENGEVTLNTPLRLEIAARLRQLTQPDSFRLLKDALVTHWSKRVKTAEEALIDIRDVTTEPITNDGYRDRLALAHVRAVGALRPTAEPDL